MCFDFVYFNSGQSQDARAVPRDHGRAEGQLRCRCRAAVGRGKPAVILTIPTTNAKKNI